MVFKVYIQVQAFYYELTHSPVSLISSLITVLLLSVKLNLKIHHTDVTTTFLNAVLMNESIFFNPLPGYYNIVPKGKSTQLFKSLYGLNHLSLMCNIIVNTSLKNKYGMMPSYEDASIYKIHKGKYFE